ncbi:MAG: serine hydrolase [Halospina sp.]
MLLIPQTGAGANWSDELAPELEWIDQSFPGELGILVTNLESDESAGVRADEVWYLASVIKVPVAVAVLEAVDQGDLALDSRIELEAADFVDGAGEINWHSPGDKVSVDRLMEQMLIHSDNTATDVLIRQVGEERVNEVAARAFSERAGRITTLKDVRRHAYSGFHEDAMGLSGDAFFELKKAEGESATLDALAGALDQPRDDFQVDSLEAAFGQYYEDGLNSAPLTEARELFSQVHEGAGLSDDSHEYLLDHLERIKTGNNRIKAGLPDDARFQHKTGTQYRRACNMGVVERDGADPVFVAVCTRGIQDVAESESAMCEVARAVTDSGVLEARD